MPESQHAVISEKCFENLLEFEQDFWGEVKDKISRYSLFPDRVMDKDYKRYCLMPNGMYIPHGPTDEKFSMVPFAPYYSRDTTKYVVNYYLTSIIEKISENNKSDSLSLACILGHFFQDSSHPIHIVNNPLVYQFLPPPEGKYWQLHRSLDSVPIDSKVIEKAKPHLLGLTIEEASFHAISEYERMVFNSRGKLVPLVMAHYSGDEETMKKLVNDCYLQAAELTTSLWHTAHCIARRKFSPEEISMLKTVRLNKIMPAFDFTLDPYFFTPLMDFACDGKGNRIPLSLKLQGDQRIETREFRDGIAMTFGYIGYEIPSEVYQKFRARVGLLSAITAKTEVVFKVVLDGGPPLYEDFHTKLVSYGGPVVYDSGIITEQDCSKEVAAELGKTSKITLITECKLPLANENLHALWVEPILLKR